MTPNLSDPSERARLAAFIRGATALKAPPLVPEIVAHLADEAETIWAMTEETLDEVGLPPPFWAFAWAGGQALARRLLDAPEAARGRRVVSLGSGAGIEAVAAAMAGAAAVLAVDLDPVAGLAAEMNAAANGVAVETLALDLFDAPEAALAAFGADVVLAGDVFYERAAADRLAPVLRICAARGATVLLGDPGRGFLPRPDLVEIARYEVPTPRALEDAESRSAAVWRMRRDRPLNEKHSGSR